MTEEHFLGTGGGIAMQGKEREMKKKGQLHVGVVFPTLDHQFQYDLWNGIAEYAKKNNIHLTAYFGTYQTTHNEFAAHYETCFEAIKNNRSLDGVIMFAGFIAQNVGLEVLESCVAKLPKGLPVVSVSFAMPGIPSVLADNVGGIYRVVEHLIQQHGKKKIAFVKGPDGHPEAEERLEGYKKALAANGIDFDAEYVLPGDFSRVSGEAAAVELLDRRKIQADAIAASDDEMAMGILSELKARKISVPSDIAVTGFDDEVASATFIPSISTARQDFFELGVLSAETLFKQINGETVEEVAYLAPVFVERESCGCALAPAQEFDNALVRKKRHAQYVEASSFRLLIRRVTSNFVLVFDIDSLEKELYRSLPELLISTALVGLYRTPIKSCEPDADRMIDRLIGFDGEKQFNIKNNNRDPMRFSDYSTLGEFDFERERRALFFLPLFIKDEEVGSALLSFDARVPMDVYETLRINISTAVKGAELLSKIQTLSLTDDLTGLYNRRGFFQFAYSRLRHLYREKDTIPIILFLDMDGLKNINDTYGHNEGDVAISAFAQTLRGALRKEDIIGRLGGDEFAVFSSVKTKEDGKQVEARIRERLDAYNSEKLHPYEVAGSIGSVILEDATKDCFDAAMLAADSVLYEEKVEKRKKGIGRN
jgi:diguanylate cyclase (GGDEF)-like protein